MNSIEIINGVTRHPSFRMKEPVNLSIADNEQIAIVGPNAGGKSRLVDIMLGRWPLLLNEVKYHFKPSSSDLVSDHIKYITFRDSYGDMDGNYYYQQRWNSQDMELSPLVKDVLPDCADNELKDRLFDIFGLREFLDKQLVLLSSGEMRRFQLAKALLSSPENIVLDNPFIGLDAKTRLMLRELLENLIEKMHIQLILILSKTDEIPSFITHVIPVDDCICGKKVTLENYLKELQPHPKKVLSDEKEESILNLPASGNVLQSNEIVKLNKVSIRYGERVILKDLDWEIHKGDKWALSGDNGSGKSTLLSLVCADNPQSYACDISLFGHKRGTGESIWDIKKHIGYVSPEMHRAYMKNLPAIDIVASGLHDSVGLFKRPHPEQYAQCEWWMDIFGIKHLSNRLFLQMSSGEQRLVLLARAFVKDPELLILDEPLHGLDIQNRRLVKDVIEAFCKRKDKTLIMVTHYKEELPACITHYMHLNKVVG